MKLFHGFVSVLIAIIVILGIGTSIAFYTSPGSASACLVTEKDRTTSPEGGSDMRVYTENCGVLAVGDNLFTGTFNSADIYGSIEVGKTYDFKTVGWRFPLFSQFPIITTATEVR